MPATRLVLADRVHALAPEAPGRADALLVRDGRILAVGRADELTPAASGAELLDLRGCTITPGLTDAHIHLLEWALSRREIDLTACRSPEECAAAVKGSVGVWECGGVGETASEFPLPHSHTPAGQGRPVDPHTPTPVVRGRAEDPHTGAGQGGGWLRGRGWNPHLWGGRYPHRDVLDAVAPERPVALQSHDMHALWVNGRALAEAGIERDTPDPPGGRIVRDAAGEPTGVLLEMAAQLVVGRIPPPRVEEAEAALLEGQGALHRLGITGVHAFPAIHLPEPDGLWVLQRLREQGRLRLRVLQHIALERLDDAIALGLRSGFGDDWLRLGAVKLFLDGALGSRTALLREPYEGEAGNRGVEAMPEDAFRAVVARAAAAGIAVAVHAIGDAAVARALDALAEPALPAPALPQRVEHLQLCPPERLAQAARAGVVASMQPAHLITDWRAADRHWGSRARTAYAFRSLLSPRAAAPGAVLAFGSDAPVEPVDPRLGFYAACARQDLEGEPRGGWYPRERISMEEVLRAYTLGPAIACGAAARAGHLGRGAAADFVAWNTDPLTTAGTELLRLRCAATVVAGEVVWREEE